MEELNPFTSDYHYDLISIVEDDDLKQWNMYSEESLVTKYRQSQAILEEANIPLPENFNYTMSEHLKEFIEIKESLLGGKQPLLGEQTASNNWVVHGDHTETGMPLYAADPHLMNAIPSFWQIYHCELSNGQVVSGISMAGVPGIAMGRTNNIVWSFTTARADTSDLWQETISADEKQYFVDGEWRDLEFINESIKVKGQPDYEF